MSNPAPKSNAPVVLFTAFEPSGDAHAAPVIAELRRMAPALKIYAWGGPKMEAAGATLIARTADDGSMGLNALGKIFSMRREISHIKRWSKVHRVLVHVPVDSPAANFPICKILRKHGTRTVHLVAPQLWAWGRGRIRKLRKRTDAVLCLLPFEEQWFNDRQVPARFIGHPVINSPLEDEDLDQVMQDLPHGAPRLALFPGSRSHEVRANIKLMVDAFQELKGRFSGLTGVIAAATPETAEIVRRRVKVFPGGLSMITGQADAVVAWCDLAIACSGTVSLNITKRHKPMIGVYKTGILSWLGSKLLLRTNYKLLPNIIAEREIVPEFIPYAFGSGPIVSAAGRFLQDSKNTAVLTEQLRRVCMRFANKQPNREAAKYIVQVAKHGKIE